MSKNLTISVGGENAEKLIQRIREEAIKKGLSMSEYIVEAIIERLRNEAP
jgi:hypothetical protein